MPSSWFYKLRSTRRASGRPDAAMAEPGSSSHAAPAAPTTQAAYTPNRASYYLPSHDRPEKPPPRRPLRHNPKLFDTHFPGGLDTTTPRRAPTYRAAATAAPHSHGAAGEGNDIVFDVLKGTPELKLRPILTRPSKNEPDESAAPSPATRTRRFKLRPRRTLRREEEAAAAAALPESRRRRWLYESLVVVKCSADPEGDFAESMAEMIAESGIRSAADLEELLACYLSLNAGEHHRAVVAAFQSVWFDLARRRLQE